MNVLHADFILLWSCVTLTHAQSGRCTRTDMYPLPPQKFDHKIQGACVYIMIVYIMKHTHTHTHTHISHLDVGNRILGTALELPYVVNKNL